MSLNPVAKIKDKLALPGVGCDNNVIAIDDQGIP
jgi:hypothetical protein